MRVDRLAEFVKLCQRHNSDIDYTTAYDLCKAQHSHASGKKEGDVTIITSLFDRWYTSIKAGTPDYSVYNSPYYIADLWACWNLYSRRYLRDITSKRSLDGISVLDDMKDVEVIADLGNGVGLTTQMIKELFPTADVYATNIDISYQYNIASELATNFTMLPDLSHLNKQTDLIFASEYFEHFDRPIEHLNFIMSIQRPRYMIVANGFNGDAIGHFDTYFHLDHIYTSKQMNSLFNHSMIRHGYQMVKTKMWNNRPTYWKFNK